MQSSTIPCASTLRRGLLSLKRVMAAVLGPATVAAQLLELWWRLRSCGAERQQAQAKTDAFARLLQELPTLTSPWSARLRRKSERWQGRGIVVVAGGERYGRLACALIDSLRAHGCLLPVEVFHIGIQEVDGCAAMAELAARPAVTLRDLAAGQPTLRDQPGYGYAAKPLALAACSFAEALLLDADNFALGDPSQLFDSGAYRESGAIFWSDMYHTSETFVRLHDPSEVRRRPSRLDQLVQDALDAWLIAPLRIRPDYAPALAAIGLTAGSLTQESGQLLCDKRRCIDALAAVGVLNSNTYRPLVYAGLHGDKDTFRVAFRALDTPYHQVASPPELGGHVDPSSGVFSDSCFVQPHPEDARCGGPCGGPGGEPPARALFLHYCGRHRIDDDERRAADRAMPTARMTAVGRPFRTWPYDGRRGYMLGCVEPFAVPRAASPPPLG